MVIQGFVGERLKGSRCFLQQNLICFALADEYQELGCSGCDEGQVCATVYRKWGVQMAAITA